MKMIQRLLLLFYSGKCQNHLRDAPILKWKFTTKLLRCCLRYAVFVINKYTHAYFRALFVQTKT